MSYSAATPTPYASTIASTEAAYGIPQGLLYNLISQESGFDPNAVNPTSGATGIAQILPSTAADPGYGIASITPGYAPSDINFAGQYLVAMKNKTGSWLGATQAYGTVPTSLANLTPGQMAVVNTAAAADTGQIAAGPVEPTTGFNSSIGGVILNPDGSIAGAGPADPNAAIGGLKLNPDGSIAGAGVGQPLTLGIQPTLASGITGWLKGIETATGTAFKGAMSGLLGSLENWVSRGFLILIGIVLAGLALWRILAPDTTPMQLARHA